MKNEPLVGQKRKEKTNKGHLNVDTLQSMQQPAFFSSAPTFLDGVKYLR
jgi:hypothetical protein